MDPPWQERAKLYPVLGTLSLLFILYVNFRDDLPFPTVLWQPKMSFVGVNSTRFVIRSSSDGGGEEEEGTLYVNGWNSYWLMQESVWSSSRPMVSEVMRLGSEMGLTVCRTWAFNDGDGANALQRRPGIFDERVFKGLDYVIVVARRRGVRLILSLVNNLDAFGGKDQYVRWAREAGIDASSSTDSFFSDPTIKEYYKAYIKAIVTRRNSISWVRYADEPAIFAWELINEPRCASNSSAPVLQAWIAEMAAYIKSLDQKHLVTVGTEGFYGLNTPNKSGANPGDWAASLGSDFIQNSAIHDIDFASVHAYPDSWLPDGSSEAKAKYLSTWMDSHISDGQDILKKPVLFTEVGSSFQGRKLGSPGTELLLETAYDRIYDSATRHGAGSGALVWQLLVKGAEGYSDRYSFIASDHPAIYKMIRHQSCRLLRLLAKNQTEIHSDKTICSHHP
uniref:mannan endo-1,4-beta-mannosidase n=1 Tax=Kalanchoe fedtschenkoi TaxID=63787 RepID=A0A7N0VEI4_KALFE